MRALLLVCLIACGPKVDPKGPSEDDLDTKPDKTAPVVAPVAEAAPRAEAPAGKGERSGTIARARLLAVLDGGPGRFLSQMEVMPHKDGDNRFIGWELVQLVDHTGPLGVVDLVPGDVLLAVNGKPISRPDQLQTIWDSLRTANSITAQLWRGNAKFELAYTIDPPVGSPVSKP